MKPYGDSEGVAPLILHPSARCRWGSTSGPIQFTPRKEPQCLLGGPQNWAGQFWRNNLLPLLGFSAWPDQPAACWLL